MEFCGDEQTKRRRMFRQRVDGKLQRNGSKRNGPDCSKMKVKKDHAAPAAHCNTTETR
jgi:hypothetical protein